MDLDVLEGYAYVINDPFTISAPIVKPRMIFVVCQRMKTCHELMRRFVESIRPTNPTVDFNHCRVKLGYDEYRFVIEYGLDVIVKGYRDAEIIFEHDFKDALDHYDKSKREAVCAGSV